MTFFPNLTDDGHGKFKCGSDGGETWTLGIYKYDGDHLSMCFRSAHLGRPTSYRAGDGQELLIIHRVKPGK
ncbi:MAG TPA: hypothetical protein VH682_31500 [Gemmataceae bacterium]